VPETIRRRVVERPDVFGALAGLDDEALDKILLSVRRKAGPTPHCR
jgi:hypothetical protein